METKFKFDHMIVHYHESNSEEYVLKIKFINSLKINPLASIKEHINIRYKLNNDRDLNFAIKYVLDSVGKWEVFDGDKPFFSFFFTNVDERKFLTVFEEQLKQTLEKLEREEHQVKFPYSSPSFDCGEAKVSMGGE